MERVADHTTARTEDDAQLLRVDIKPSERRSGKRYVTFARDRHGTKPIDRDVIGKVDLARRGIAKEMNEISLGGLANTNLVEVFLSHDRRKGPAGEAGRNEERAGEDFNFHHGTAVFCTKSGRGAAKSSQPMQKAAQLRAKLAIAAAEECTTSYPCTALLHGLPWVGLVRDWLLLAD